MNTVINPDLRILLALADLCTITNRSYCWPSQQWLLDALRKRYQRQISRRSLNRHLLSLVNRGLIRRTCRHRRGPTGAMEMHSTLYNITSAARKLLSRNAIGPRKRGPGIEGENPNNRVPASAQYLNPLYRLERLPGLSAPAAAASKEILPPNLAARDWAGLSTWLRSKQ